MKQFFLLLFCLYGYTGMSQSAIDSGDGALVDLARDLPAPPEQEKLVVTELAQVTGTVYDEFGDPIPGVNVLIKNTTTGTTTDGAGQYTISVDDKDAVLIFSFVGYQIQEITVGSQTVIDVNLVVDSQTLAEVVVTALGVKRESKKLGYAVTSIQPDDLVKNRTTNVMESLEGQVAGLNITPPAAGAGSSTQIRLRGQAAFAGASNSPLIVINGLPIDQGAQGANGFDQQRDRGDNMNNINPDDIESMTVLKGATAAALYGSRAANGAIIITTKSGQLDQGLGVEFSSSFTAQKPLNYFDFQQKFGQGRNGLKPVDAADAAGTGQFGWGAPLDGSMVPIFDGSMQPYEAHPDRYFDYLRTGKVFTNTIALSGGGAKGSFRTSFSNTDADGIEPTNEYKRRIFNVGINHKISNKLGLSLNINYANEDYINPPQVGTQGPGSANFFTRLSTSIPLSALKNSAVADNGTERQTSGFQGTILNPYYARAAGDTYEESRDRLLGTATLKYEITDWLYAQGRFNYDYSLNFIEDKTPGGIGTSEPKNTADGTYKGSYGVSEYWGTDINADFLLGASKQFERWSLDANFGGNTFRVKDRNMIQNVQNFVVRDFFSISNGTNQTQSHDFSEYRVNSLYGLAEFGYNGILYLNFTGRTDWFSTLNPENNSKFYPSISGSFIFSELMQDQTWLSYAKLRASWAQVGSSNGVEPYDGNLNYLIADNQFNGQTTATINGTQAPNQFLQPFTVTEKEIGLDVRMLNHRLRFDVGLFDKVTTDQILSVQLSDASGYTESKQNLGSLKNSGVEFMIEYTAQLSSNLTWTTSLNNTYLHTEVLSVGKNPDGTPVEDLLLIYFNGTGNEFLGELHYTVGMPMNQLYTRTYLRDDAGNILLTDEGRLIPSTDFIPVGSSIPKYTGGWNNSFTFKNLTLGVFVDYKLGGTVLSSTLLNATRQGHSKLSLEGRRDGESGLTFPGVYQSNGEPNTSVVTDLQGFYGDYRNFQIGDPFTFKSDFVKLRSVSLSYDITSSIQKLSILKFVRGLSLTASCRNVAILYKDLPNLDPEAMQSSGDTRAGYENSSLPTTRNFMFGLNAKF